MQRCNALTQPIQGADASPAVFIRIWATRACPCVGGQGQPTRRGVPQCLPSTCQRKTVRPRWVRLRCTVTAGVSAGTS